MADYFTTRAKAPNIPKGQFSTVMRPFTAAQAAQKRWGFKDFDPVPGLPSGRGTFMPVGYTQTPPPAASIESEWATPELLKDFLIMMEGTRKPIAPEEVFKGLIGPTGGPLLAGVAKTGLKGSVDPSTLRMFVGGVPKGAGKGTPAPKETIDLLTKKYPHAAAREEQYIVTERHPAKVGRYGSPGLQKVEIFPGTTPSVVPRRPGDPSGGSMVYNPELGQIRKIEHIDTDTGVDLSLNIVEPKKQSLALPDKKSDNIMYRGMSSEEFDQALKTGHFKSKGDYNVQGQDDLTYWSSRPSQAQNYASSFAPWQFKPTFERPAYVVGVKRKNVARIDADTELGVSGKTPVNDVVEIYKGDVHAITPGRHHIVDDWGTPRISGSSLESHVTWSKYDKGVTKKITDDIRPAKENINTVIDANTVGGRVSGDEIVNIKTLSGGPSKSSRGQKAVKEIVEKMKGPEGYIERLIVDQDGNVIEGAHRLEALRRLGVEDVPITRIVDPTANINTASMRDAIEGVGNIRSDHVNQIMAQVGGMLDEVGGDPSKVIAEFELPRGFEKFFHAALKSVVKK